MLMACLTKKRCQMMNPYFTNPIASLFDELTNISNNWDTKDASAYANNILNSKSLTVRFSSVEDNDYYYIRVLSPGFKEDELNISIQQNRLTVTAKKGEKVVNNYNQLFCSEVNGFEKSFLIPQNIDTAKITAEYRSGILVVSIPKQNINKEEPQNIKISFGDKAAIQN